MEAYNLCPVYMCAKSNVCIPHTSKSISKSLIQRWPYVYFTCNIHSSWVAHFTSASLMWIEDRIMIRIHVKLASGPINLSNDPSATHGYMWGLNWALPYMYECIFCSTNVFTYSFHSSTQSPSVYTMCFIQEWTTSIANLVICEFYTKTKHM